MNIPLKKGDTSFNLPIIQKSKDESKTLGTLTLEDFSATTETTVNVIVTFEKGQLSVQAAEKTSGSHADVKFAIHC